MPYSFKTALLVVLGFISLIFSACYVKPKSEKLPVVAIANYGPHASLHESIQGIKEGLALKGLVENKNFKFEILDANFEHTLIRQMLAKLKASHPAVIVAISTPVAQAAKTITTIPIVFSDVTSPVEAGLLKNEKQPLMNMTGASDRQDLCAFLKFAKTLLPHAKRIGLLYATTDANDLSLVKMMQAAAKQFDMEVVLVPVEHPNEVKLRMQAFKNKVDFIYVGVSGPIQPSLPTIAASASRMNIPVFNADSDAVKSHQVLGSYGVSYYQVGVNTADIVFEILQGKAINLIAPRYPQLTDHAGYISTVVAKKLGIAIPSTLENINLVE